MMDARARALRREDALNQLRMRKQKQQSKSATPESSSTPNSSAPQHTSSSSSSLPSKYFSSATPSSSSTPSVLLVPNSSPAPASPAKRTYEPHHHINALPPPSPQARASFERGGWSDDVMRPTLGRTSSSSARRDDQPPQKRRNLGDGKVATSSDDMPRINRTSIFAPKPKPAPPAIDLTAAASSDVEMVEDTPDRDFIRLQTPPSSFPLSTPAKSPGSSPLSSAPASPAQPAASDPRLGRLHTLHPEYTLPELDRLLKECNGDMKALAQRISSGLRVDTSRPTNNFKARRDVIQSPETPLVRAAGGRNIIQSPDATRTRGKQSTIYQNTKAPPVTRPKRRLVESDEEEEEDEKGRWSGGSDEDNEDDNEDVIEREVLAVSWFNEVEPQAIVEVTACTLDQATIIVSLRPFDSPSDIRSKLTKKKGVTPRVFEDYVDILEGYSKVDSLLTRCEAVGKELTAAVGTWSDGSGIETTAASRASSEPPDSDRTKVDSPPAKTGEAMLEQPTSLTNIQLKDYQLYGLSWLSLLSSRRLSCILADEMGLGKTIQVIALFAYLKEQGINGRHLIVVPSSTLENWLREFRRFAPSLNVQSYYGSQTERRERREELRVDEDWDVLITTYTLAQGSEADRKFLGKKVQFDTAVFDEGHVLKNYQSQRYHHLMQIKVPWRLMLTGTPLQNNLQELVSLLNFLLPKYFTEAQESLRAIFKVKADSSASFLSRERVSRAKTMMTPFVLRRRKDQVLRDLPKKFERIEWCGMTPLQTGIYRDALKRSRKTLATLPDDEEEATHGTRSKKKPKAAKLKANETSTNVLMDLRKAAVHPMLFRQRFDDDKVRVIAKKCLREPEFAESNFNLVVEDMQVMTDAELQLFCEKYKSVRADKLDEHCWGESGKVETLLRLIAEYRSQGRRMLVFSQFVQVLDILRQVLDGHEIRYLVLTGSTPVDLRQSLVDEFSENEDIPVFLLSTKAGGMGINLTAASVVFIFDQDFNPHNDRQAADRAYRIGQKRDVDIVKFITRGTIEEDMYQLGQTKLALDVAVAGGEEGDEDEPDAGEKVMKASLMSVLRKKLENDGDDALIAGTTQLVTEEEAEKASTVVAVEEGGAEMAS